MEVSGAKCLVALASVASMTKKAVKEDKAQWVERQSNEIAKQLRAGQTGGLWKLVQQLAGRKRRGPQAVEVLKDDGGKLITTEEAKTAEIEKMMLAEFQGRGAFVEDQELSEKVAEHERQLAPLGDSELPEQEDLESEIMDSVRAMKMAKLSAKMACQSSSGRSLAKKLWEWLVSWQDRCSDFACRRRGGQGRWCESRGSRMHHGESRTAGACC